jgi:hypothetical protein
MRNCLIFGILFSIIFSCKKKDNKDDTTLPLPGTVSINGKVNKGPYKNGSPLVVFELNSSLGQTGKSFSSTINDYAGNFTLNNVGLTTGFALLTANGYYFMEHFNSVSQNQLYMEAISDVSSNARININLLTHIIKPRIEYLVLNGLSFASARTQAQNELLVFMGIPSGINTNFEQLDITNDAFLFAASLLFQRRTAGYNQSYNYTSELSSLLNKFRNDFMDNGQINSTALIDTLVYNANRIQLIDVKEDLQAYMASLGVNIVPPNFEQYIYTFQKLYSNQVFVNLVFPDTALYDTDHPPVSMIKNILFKPSVNFQGSGRPYLLSAVVPCDSTLSIKFTSLSTGSNQYTIGQPYYGWKLTSSTNEFTIESQRKNFQNALMLTLWGTTGQDSARVEYFEKNNPAPFFTKIIYW